MEFDYKKPSDVSCPNVSCSKKKDDCCGITKVSIPAVLGDDSDTSNAKPFNGAYCNKIVEYEANGAIYFYSADGIYTKLSAGLIELEKNCLHRFGQVNIRIDNVVSELDELRERVRALES